jgi:hypothetical protein
MNQTTNRMKRAAAFFLTARLHALCVAACRRLLAQAGLASGAAVGRHMPAMETLHRHHVAIRFQLCTHIQGPCICPP